MKAAVYRGKKGEVDPAAFITSEASLDDVPEVLRRLAEGPDGLKTAILPLRGRDSGRPKGQKSERGRDHASPPSDRLWEP